MLNHREALRQQYAAHPQVRRILRHRQVPKHVYKNSEKHRIIKEKEKRKDHNRRTHSKPGKVPFVPETKKHVIKEDE